MVDSSLSVSLDPVGASLVGLLGLVEVAVVGLLGIVEVAVVGLLGIVAVAVPVATDCAVTSPASLPEKNNALPSSADKAMAAKPADNKRFLPAGFLVGIAPTTWCSGQGEESPVAPTTGCWTGGSSSESESSGSAAATSAFSVWAAIGSSFCPSPFSVSAAEFRPLTAARAEGISTVAASSERSGA